MKLLKATTKVFGGTCWSAARYLHGQTKHRPQQPCALLGAKISANNFTVNTAMIDSLWNTRSFVAPPSLLQPPPDALLEQLPTYGFAHDTNLFFP